MKKILFLAFIFSSCAILDKKESDRQKINISELTEDMSFFNKQFRGYLFRYELKNNLSNLNKDIYFKGLKDQIKPAQKSYPEFISTYKPEIALKSNNKDFAICLKSIEAKLILCDQAFTATTDLVIDDMSLDIQEFIKTVPLNN